MSNIKARNGQPVNSTSTYEFQFPQPKEHVPFKHFVYNPKEGTIFGRTPASWSKLLLFYLVFYAVLGALFAICLKVLLSTLKDNEPKFLLEESLIGNNPGLGFRPISEVTERGSIIKFGVENKEEGEYWVSLLDEFLEPYKDKKLLSSGGKNQQHCNFDTQLQPGKSCAVDIENFGPCSPKENYGYKTQKPCIFLKLNKIFGWLPEIYDANNIPAEMPTELVQHIKKLPKNQQQQIWVSCKGQHSLDKELIQNITYYPTPGFPAYFYPFTNTEEYLSPLVAIQITPAKYNQLISIECRAWAKNIIYSGSLRDRKGSVTFQLNIDTPINSTSAA